MLSKSPSAAVDAAAERLRLVATCVTERPILATGHRLSPHANYLGFAPHREPVRLRSRRVRRGLLLWMTLDYEVVSTAEVPTRFEVRATSYRYQLLDHDRREILAYHWHPHGVSPVVGPHLHLSGRVAPLPIAGGDDAIALGGMHLPTGLVTLADIVRLLITEFGVEARRADWDAVLDAHRNPFDSDV